MIEYGSGAPNLAPVSRSVTCPDPTAARIAAVIRAKSAKNQVTLGDQRPDLKKHVKPSAQAAQVPGGHWHGVGAARRPTR
jgi:hypothetical protein